MSNSEPNKGLSFAVFFIAYSLIGIGVLYGMHAVGLGATPIIVVGLIVAGGGLLGAYSRTLSGGKTEATP